MRTRNLRWAAGLGVLFISLLALSGCAATSQAHRNPEGARFCQDIQERAWCLYHGGGPEYAGMLEH